MANSDDEIPRTNSSDEENKDDDSETVVKSVEDATNSKWITQAIGELHEQDIGGFNTSNKNFVAHLKATAAIRDTVSPTDYPELTKGVMAIMNLNTTEKTFSSLKKISEFIIHLHNKYKVNFHPGLTNDKNRILQSTMESMYRKLKKHIQSISNRPLTSIQFITIL
jgi:hypothetical protein